MQKKKKKNPANLMYIQGRKKYTIKTDSEVIQMSQLVDKNVKRVIANKPRI